MTCYETTSVGLSILAILISIFSFFYAHKQKKNSEGQLELQIEEAIKASEKYVVETVTESDKLRAFAICNYLNTFETACAKYLDNKIDKKRFKKEYKKSVDNLFEDEEIAMYLGANSKYTSIIKFYNS